MPLGGKALKRREQAKDAKNGIIRDELTLRKAANAKADVLCKLCATSFKLTKKNVDARTHAESKHPGKTFAECFPDCIKHEEMLAKPCAAGAGGGKDGGAGKKGGAKKKKGDDMMAMLSEGLAKSSVKDKKGAAGGKKSFFE
mmetsp:Transcript_18002/g.53539  ORF Transcript_18002/g.53539 Transcript_18002/m.53539 type:complete len:142 (-) Transcript_18002:15-440(-)